MGSYQRKDHYYRRARDEGYRSRAAYKLLEIQSAHGLLRRGQRVADLGCWPGSWLQVSSGIVGPSGRVAGVDLAELEPGLTNEHVFAFQADLTDAATPARLRDALGGPADVLLSDAAPKLSGVKAADRAREEALLEAIESLIPLLLREGGDLLVKLLEAPEAAAAARRMGGHFRSAKRVRPASSRKGTREQYLLARGYRGES